MAPTRERRQLVHVQDSTPSFVIYYRDKIQVQAKFVHISNTKIWKLSLQYHRDRFLCKFTSSRVSKFKYFAKYFKILGCSKTIMPIMHWSIRDWTVSRQITKLCTKNIDLLYFFNKWDCYALTHTVSPLTLSKLHFLFLNSGVNIIEVITYHSDEPVQCKSGRGKMCSVVKRRNLVVFPRLVPLIKKFLPGRVQCSNRL